MKRSSPNKEDLEDVKVGDGELSTAVTGQRLRRVLAVSRIFPSDFRTAVHGAYQRLRLFLEAAASAAEFLDILFLVEPDFLDRYDGSSFADALRQHWGIEANITLASRVPKSNARWHATFAPILFYRHFGDIARMSGTGQTEAVRRALRPDTDLVFAYNADAAVPIIALGNARPPLALDLNDILHLATARALARPPRAYFEYLYLPALFLGERRIIRAAAVSFVCSHVAKHYLQPIVGRDCRLAVAPNAAKFPKRTGGIPNKTRTPTLIFVGLFAYEPNREAAIWLIEHVMPHVLERVPDARLMLVGNGIERIDHLRATARQVDFVGFVDDLSAAYEQSTVACSPIFTGGGTRTKIIEAAALHIPIVSTTLGAEGIDLVHGSEILLRDDAISFARACASLLLDPARARAMADAAFLRARQYDRASVIPAIAQDLRAAADQRG